MNRALVITLGLVLLGPELAVAKTLPFSVELRGKAKMNEVRAERIYYSVCRRVAKEISISHPPKLEPKFVLIVGDKNRGNHILFGGSKVDRVYLARWNEFTFAHAVAWIASARYMRHETLIGIARLAIGELNATIDVKELQAPH